MTTPDTSPSARPPALPRPGLVDRIHDRILLSPASARWAGWIAPLLITLVAGILRLWNLGNPHALMFDETYYVKDAWSQWNLGYPSDWPEGADKQFANGETDIFSSAGSFVVHPPLGKVLIGAGMALFGADSSVGWRFSAAIFGTATVLVLYFVARALTRSVVFASVASGLMAIDGLAIVMSRVSLLDIFLTFFVLLGFWFIVLDRQQHIRMLRALLPRRAEGYLHAPLLWKRPWLVAAGAAFGAATAVKWSGLYVLAGFGLYIVITDALANRRLGVHYWPTQATLQGAIAFVLYIPVAVIVYLSSWTSWLASTGGYGRDASDGFFGPFIALFEYHRSIYQFHVGLTAEHGYASPAWQWPLLLRPTAIFFEGSDGCGDPSGCAQNIYSMPNPLIWYAAVAAVLYLIYRFAADRNWRYAIVLVGVAVTFGPWMLYPERTIFQFYTIVMLPFMLLALTFCLREIAGPSRRWPARRQSGQGVVIVFLVVAIALSAWWYPILIAETVPYGFWRMHAWLPSWI